MKLWDWIKLAFSPKQPAIDMVLETEIANLKAHMAMQIKRRDHALEDAAKAKARKKRQFPYRVIAQRATAKLLSYELELAELEKRRA